MRFCNEMFEKLDRASSASMEGIFGRIEINVSKTSIIDVEQYFLASLKMPTINLYT